MENFREKEICNIPYDEMMGLVGKGTYLLIVSIGKNGGVKKRVINHLHHRNFDDGTDTFHFELPEYVIGGFAFTYHQQNVSGALEYAPNIKDKFICSSLEEVNEVYSSWLNCSETKQTRKNKIRELINKLEKQYNSI